MPSSPTPSAAADFALGAWTVEPSRNLLACGSDARVVGPKVMNLLLVLAEAPGHVVSKEDLVARLWQGDFVTDEVLTTLVYALRRALGDDARRPRFVETVRGRGYRLVAPVRGLAAVPVPQRQGPARRWLALAAAALLIAGLALQLPRFADGAAGADTRRVESPPALAPKAAEAYALGRHFLDRGGLDDLEKAKRHFGVAVRAAPGFAPARVALADAWIETVAALPPAAQQGALDHAHAAAKSALAVDAALPSAHRALGWLALQRDWDSAGAEAHFARAGLDARGGERHLARFLSARGEHSAAIEVGARAVAAAPARAAARLALAEIFYHARRYDDARHELDQLEELEAPSSQSARLRADVLGGLGHHSEALQACIRDVELSGLPAIDAAALDAAFADTGPLGARRLLFQQLARISTPAPDALRLARLGAASRDTEATLDWLDRAVAEHHAGVVWLGADPIYDLVRHDPRFQGLLARIGLAFGS